MIDSLDARLAFGVDAIDCDMGSDAAMLDIQQALLSGSELV